MNLRYSYEVASWQCNENRHACVVMKELGITWKDSVPQSLGDQFWFLDCENVPDVLPEFITEL